MRRNKLKKSEFLKIVEEEVKAALAKFTPTPKPLPKYFGKSMSPQDLGTMRFQKQQEPTLKRRIEALEAILKYIPQGSTDYKTLKSILDDAKLGMRVPTDKQMAMASAILGKYLKESKSEPITREKIKEEIKKKILSNQ